MQFKNTFIPYSGYWSTPFVRWQGSFANLNAVPFAAEVAINALKEKNIQPSSFDAVYLGITIPQKHSFYGAPWLAGMIGAPGITGPMMAQACATSARLMANAAAEIETSRKDKERTILAIACDRTSNGPQIIYPNPRAPGGKGDLENWVWDNFGYDPHAKNPMLVTGENTAKEAGITREDQEKMVLLRYKQYQDATKDDAAFLRRFMTLPTEVKAGKKVIKVEGDEGVFPTTAEGLAKLRPVMKEGTITFGAQTHPADGNCGMIVTTREKAGEMSLDKDYEIQLLSFGQARSKKGFMPMAPVPAARNALETAQLSMEDITAFKLHNPFAVNDVYFSQEMGIAAESINNYGSSLVWGHPQAPTGMRLIIELIEELVLKKGGRGLFAGCSAGDSGAAMILDVIKK